MKSKRPSWVKDAVHQGSIALIVGFRHLDARHERNRTGALTCSPLSNGCTKFQLLNNASHSDAFREGTARAVEANPITVVSVAPPLWHTVLWPRVHCFQYLTQSVGVTRNNLSGDPDGTSHHRVVMALDRRGKRGVCGNGKPRQGQRHHRHLAGQTACDRGRCARPIPVEKCLAAHRPVLHAGRNGPGLPPARLLSGRSLSAARGGAGSRSRIGFRPCASRRSCPYARSSAAGCG